MSEAERVIEAMVRVVDEDLTHEPYVVDVCRVLRAALEAARMPVLLEAKKMKMSDAEHLVQDMSAACDRLLTAAYGEGGDE